MHKMRSQSGENDFVLDNTYAKSYHGLKFSNVKKTISPHLTDIR